MALYGKELQTYHGTYHGNVNQSAADLQAAHATAHGATAHVGSRKAIGKSGSTTIDVAVVVEYGKMRLILSYRYR